MAYSRGKLYDRRKKQSADNLKQNRPKGQNVPSESDETTAEEVGKETGASDRTTKRDAEYSRAVDALTKVFGRDFQAHVLSGESKLSKTDVVMLAGELGKNVEHLCRISLGHLREGLPIGRPSAMLIIARLA